VPTQDQTSTGFGANEWMVEEMRAAWSADPSSVSPEWRELFETDPSAGLRRPSSTPSNDFANGLINSLVVSIIVTIVALAVAVRRLPLGLGRSAPDRRHRAPRAAWRDAPAR